MNRAVRLARLPLISRLTRGMAGLGVVFLTANRFELWSLPGQENTHAISRN